MRSPPFGGRALACARSDNAFENVVSLWTYLLRVWMQSCQQGALRSQRDADRSVRHEKVQLMEACHELPFHL